MMIGLLINIEKRIWGKNTYQQFAKGIESASILYQVPFLYYALEISAGQEWNLTQLREEKSLGQYMCMCMCVYTHTDIYGTLIPPQVVWHLIAPRLMSFEYSSSNLHVELSRKCSPLSLCHCWSQWTGHKIYGVDFIFIHTLYKYKKEY